MAEEDKKEGAVPPRLDLRKSVVGKPSSGQAPVTATAAPNVSAPSVAPAVMAPKPAVPVQPEVQAPSAPQPMPAPTVSSPVPAPVKQAPAAVKPVQPVVPQPVSAVQAPQVNQAPSNILKPASSPVPVKPLASSGGPITLKAGAPMVKPIQPVSQGPANVQAPVAAPAAPATQVATVVPAAPVAPAAPAPVAPAASPAPSAAPVVIVPKPAAPVQPAAASGGLSPAVRPGAGISPLKPSAAPVNPLRPAGAKPTLKIGAMPSAQAKTIRLTPGGTKPKAPVPAGAVVVQDAKKETSKIPLDAAQPVAGPTLKTPTGPIELKPNEADGKRKTSRISLESVLAADDAESPESSGPSSGPKTIKLKRPSEAVTIKAIKKGPVVARPAEPVAADLSKTAPLDEIADGATASGKRTVKVRRPSMKIKAGGGAAGGAGDGASPAAAAVAHGKAAEVVYEDTAHWVFWLFSLAAVLVVSVMTYMFTSQVIGPDYSLTKASYYTEGYNLDWPYKLSKMP